MLTSEDKASWVAPPEPGATDAKALMQLVYRQLRAIAQQRMNDERAGHTLEPTALVHEAYLRLSRDQSKQWRTRGQFLSAAAEAMRRILIDHARSRLRIKRGGGRRRAPVNVLDLAACGDPDQILSVDEAIQRLEDRDPRLAELVRLRFFGGLSVEETARVLGVCDRTIRRDWSLARAILSRDLRAT